MQRSRERATGYAAKKKLMEDQVSEKWMNERAFVCYPLRTGVPCVRLLCVCEKSGIYTHSRPFTPNVNPPNRSSRRAS